MDIRTRKSKMVSIRLSPEEYRAFRDACVPHGVSSISELARTAMQNLLKSSAAMSGGFLPLDDQVRDLRDRVNFLSEQVDNLTRRFQTGE